MSYGQLYVAFWVAFGGLTFFVVGMATGHVRVTFRRFRYGKENICHSCPLVRRSFEKSATELPMLPTAMQMRAEAETV